VISTRRHLAGFEGIRGIAALLVLFSHVGLHAITKGTTGAAGYWASWSAQGLTLFFALSGFLLFGPYVRAILHREQLPGTARYARNRLLRIYPAYLVIFLLVNYVLQASYTKGTTTLFPDSIGTITDPGVLLPNLLLVQSLVPATVATGIGPAWSLTTELTFYLLLPLLAFGAAALAKRVPASVAVLAPPALLIVVGIATNVALNHGLATATDPQAYSWGHTWTAVATRSLLSQADLFAYGMIAAVVFELIATRAVPRWVAPTLLVAAAIVAYLGVRYWVAWNSTVVGIAAGAALVAIAIPLHGRANGPARFLELAPVKFLGLISYSIYLWHVPVVYWLLERGIIGGGGRLALLTSFLITAAVVIALSTVTFYLVEKPAMRLRGALPSRRVNV
jgi:peptidoglycan/LPS O-acetylase OafA/YrhL